MKKQPRKKGQHLSNPHHLATKSSLTSKDTLGFTMRTWKNYAAITVAEKNLLQGLNEKTPVGIRKAKNANFKIAKSRNQNGMKNSQTSQKLMNKPQFFLSKNENKIPSSLIRSRNKFTSVKSPSGHLIHKSVPSPLQQQTVALTISTAEVRDRRHHSRKANTNINHFTYKKSPKALRRNQTGGERVLNNSRPKLVYDLESFSPKSSNGNIGQKLFQKKQDRFEVQSLKRPSSNVIFVEYLQINLLITKV